MKKIALFLGISAAALLSAQNKPLCGYDMLVDQTEKSFPGYKAAVKQTFNDALLQSASFKSAAVTYTVNVVVHVVWKNAVENLHDSIIQSQIDVLNEDFNRMNADTGNLRTLFKPIAGAAGIHFNLAQVIRKQTTSTFTFGFAGIPNQMKHDSLGGDNAIDPDHYLNIWVCAMQPSFFGQILGFAFPPANMSNWPANSAAPKKSEDGVVIDYHVFGRNNPNPISIDGTNNLDVKGRTPTHEVGHYFGLRHIWGDGGGFGGGNNCTGDDGIADTPSSDAQSNFDCDISRNTCVDAGLPWTTTNAPDMIEDYMDYSSEACMNTFTQGQADLIISVINGPRVSLQNVASSVSEAELLKRSISVFPNPANEMVSISSFNHVITEAEIVNVLGETIYRSAVTDGRLNLNTSAFSNGTYFVRSLIEGKLITSKLVISK